MDVHSPLLLDRHEMVLVVIDVQERLAAAMPRRDQVVGTIARLTRAFRLLGAPVIVVRHYAKGLGEIVPGLAAVFAEAAEESTGRVVGPVDKTAFCCCREPGFVLALEGTRRRQVVLTGMETHICVAQTAIELVRDHFTVQVVADGCCSQRESDHEVALDRLRHAGASVTTSEAAIYEAAAVAATDEFRRLRELLRAE